MAILDEGGNTTVRAALGFTEHFSAVKVESVRKRNQRYFTEACDYNIHAVQNRQRMLPTTVVVR